MFLRLRQLPKFSKPYAKPSQAILANWNLALYFTPNKRGKTADRKEMAELIATNEKRTILLFLLEALLMPGLPLKEELQKNYIGPSNSSDCIFC